MIITVAALNQLENKYTPNGLGVEIIEESELTYNKVSTAVNNGLLPILKQQYTHNNALTETYFSILTNYYTSGNTRHAIFSNQDFTADSDSAIMTQPLLE